MKKAIGWVLVVFGGLYFICSVLSIPILLTNENATLEERVLGADFLIQYFKMIEEETGIPENSLAKPSSEQGRHLSKYAWQ